MAVEIIQESRVGIFSWNKTIGRTRAWFYEGSNYGQYDGIGGVDLLVPTPMINPNRVVIFPSGLKTDIQVKDKNGKHTVKRKDEAGTHQLGELTPENPQISITSKKSRKKLTFRMVNNNLDDLPLAETL